MRRKRLPHATKKHIVPANGFRCNAGAHPHKKVHAHTLKHAIMHTHVRAITFPACTNTRVRAQWCMLEWFPCSQNILLTSEYLAVTH